MGKISLCYCCITLKGNNSLGSLSPPRIIIKKKGTEVKKSFSYWSLEMFFTLYLLPLQCLYTNSVQAGFGRVDYFVLSYLKNPQDVVFTVVLRLCLPVTAICASLPSSPCKLLLPRGAVVSQVRELIQAKPIFLLPWGCFPLISRGSGSGAALFSQPPVVHKEGPIYSGTALAVGSFLASPRACRWAAFWKLSTPCFALYHAFLCNHTRPRNVPLLSNKVSVRNHPTIQGSEALFCTPAIYSQPSWCSWSSSGLTSHEHGPEANTASPPAPAPPRFITAQRHHTHIPQILANMDKLNFGSSPWHEKAGQFSDPVSAFWS